MKYRVTDSWIFNGGAMLENSQMSSTFLSPKLGVTYKLSEQESIRLNASKAVRTPDLSISTLSGIMFCLVARRRRQPTLIIAKKKKKSPRMKWVIIIIGRVRVYRWM
jgi:hypothetical protein